MISFCIKYVCDSLTMKRVQIILEPFSTGYTARFLMISEESELDCTCIPYYLGAWNSMKLLPNQRTSLFSRNLSNLLVNCHKV